MTLNILYLVHELPVPAVAGHLLRFNEIIEALPDAVVHVIGYAERGGASFTIGRASYQPVCGPVRIRRRPFALLRAIVVSLLTRQPYSIVKCRTAALARAVRRRCRDSPPDIVIAGVFTQHVVPPGRWTLIADVHNIEHELWQAFADQTTGPLAWFMRREARLMARGEQAAWRRADGIIAISADDAAHIAAQRGTAPVWHLPVAIEPPPVAVGHPRWHIGLIGVWSWRPNAAAIARFATLIAPRLRAAGLTVCVAGPGLDRHTAKRLSDLGVDCLGFVPDLGPFYRDVKIVAAPYEIGGGVRMKVAEALSNGRPVIGTALSFRGIGPGIPLDWVADGAEDLAARLARFAREDCTVPGDIAEHHSLSLRRERLATLIVALTAPTVGAQRPVRQCHSRLSMADVAVHPVLRKGPPAVAGTESV